MFFSEFIGISSRLFFHPFKTLIEVYEILQSESKENILKLAFLASLMGNISLIISSIVIRSGRVWESLPFLIFHILFNTLIFYTADFILLAVIYYALSLFRKEVEWDKLTGIYLFTDFLWFILLPSAIILKPFLPYGEIIFSILIILLFIIIFLLKIKAVSISTSLSRFKSTGLLLTPFIFILILTGISVIYIIYFLSRFFM
jgi:hypothetical protein